MGSPVVARKTRSGRAPQAALILLSALAVVAAGCGGGGGALPVANSDDASTVVTVRVDENPTMIDPRLFGTNVPAWLGPEGLADPVMRERVIESGATVLRMPGGSWSNHYDWLACEIGDEESCFWPWAARPTDFIDFMQSTDVDGMWTVSINHTAEAAAAAVSFFNGSTDDERVIGVDRNGTDWATVGTWAQLRADHGHPEPSRIGLWEVGNEVYGATPDAGPDCASFGWEEVWTCDGVAYVNGDGEHDGYLDFQRAMTDVDPTIEIGIVGVDDTSGWGNWGPEVIENAAGAIDFYVVHRYGFDQSPSPTSAISRPAQLWPRVITDVRDHIGDDLPIAVTEYNLIATEDSDTEQSMNQALNALYLADSIGQMATHGVAMANQWNLANGDGSTGTDYGMVDIEDGRRAPQFWALEMWSSVGEQLFSTDVSDDDLRVYPTRNEAGAWSVVMLNLSSRPSSVSLGIESIGAGHEGRLSSASTTDLTATELTIVEDSAVSVNDGLAVLDLPGWSINLLEISDAG